MLGVERKLEIIEDVYPNPAQETINFQFVAGESSQVKYEIFDSLGRLVREQNILCSSGLNLKSINISDLENGLYHFKTIVDNESKNEILIKN